MQIVWLFLGVAHDSTIVHTDDQLTIVNKKKNPLIPTSMMMMMMIFFCVFFKPPPPYETVPPATPPAISPQTLPSRTTPTEPRNYGSYSTQVCFFATLILMLMQPWTLL